MGRRDIALPRLYFDHAYVKELSRPFTVPNFGRFKVTNKGIVRLSVQTMFDMPAFSVSEGGSDVGDAGKIYEKFIFHVF